MAHFLSKDVASRNFSISDIKLPAKEKKRAVNKILIEIESNEKIKIYYSWNFNEKIYIFLIIYL